MVGGWNSVPVAVWVLFADPRVDVSSNEIIHAKRQHCPVNVSRLIVLNCPQLGLMIPTVCPIGLLSESLSQTLGAGSVSEFRIF